jgi:hypothetical protein
MFNGKCHCKRGICHWHNHDGHRHLASNATWLGRYDTLALRAGGRRKEKNVPFFFLILIRWLRTSSKRKEFRGNSQSEEPSPHVPAHGAPG